MGWRRTYSTFTPFWICDAIPSGSRDVCGTEGRRTSNVNNSSGCPYHSVESLASQTIPYLTSLGRKIQRDTLRPNHDNGATDSSSSTLSRHRVLERSLGITDVHRIFTRKST